MKRVLKVLAILIALAAVGQVIHTSFVGAGVGQPVFDKDPTP